MVITVNRITVPFLFAIMLAGCHNMNVRCDFEAIVQKGPQPLRGMLRLALFQDYFRRSLKMRMIKRSNLRRTE